MICKVCNKVPDPNNAEDCFEKALNTLQQHYNCKLWKKVTQTPFC